MTDAAANTQSITINKEPWTIPAPFAEGHTLTAVEAGVLNQTFAENVRNNIASRIRAFEEAGKKEGASPWGGLDSDAPAEEGQEAQTYRQSLQDYADSYEFGVRRTSSREPVDPVQREAHRIATDLVNAKLSKAGTKKKDLPEGVFDAAVEKARAHENVQKLAAKRVKEREGLAGLELDVEGLEAADETQEQTES